MDTVKNGGTLDGQYGILAGWLAVERLLKKHGRPSRSIEVVSFPEAMQKAGFDFEAVCVPRRTGIAAFIEAHIEQGGVLESLGRQVGVVSDIVGLLCFGWVAIWVYRTVLTPIYSEIQQSLGVTSDASIGAIASVYFFAYTGMQIPSGILVDRFGVRAVLIPGFALFTLAALIIGSAYSLSAKTIPQKKRTFSNAIINSGSSIGMAAALVANRHSTPEAASIPA